jgi:protein N-terminal methyltransferase
MSGGPESGLEALWSSETKQDWYGKGVNYWDGVDATVDGVLGGYESIHTIDIRDSEQFLKAIQEKRRFPWSSCADCGAGIGRITQALLGKKFQRVDLVEPCAKFVAEAKKNLKEDRFQYFNVGMESFAPPPNSYDVVWIQWVIGHFQDDDFVNLLQRLKQALTENGVIIIKDNIAAKEHVFDKQDHSVTRNEAQLRKIFQAAGMSIAAERMQRNFPKELFKVKMFALVPVKQ